MAGADSQEVWIIDTSSIIQLRQSNLSGAEQTRILAALGKLVASGGLRYPREVLKELERGCSGREPDERFLWAKVHAEVACADRADFDRLRKVLSRVPTLLDPDKSGVEEADPYVVSLALGLKDAGADVCVVTEDRKDKPMKMSLRTACGLWKVPSVPLLAYLQAVGVLP